MELPSDIQSNEKILFCVLNWGLGHASRSIPIIKSLVAKGHQVSIASDGLALTLLQKELPNLSSHTLPSYNIRYGNNSMFLSIISQLPKLAYAFQAEKKVVAKLVEANNYSLILSDNRYGCRYKKVKNVFIGHQIRILQSKLKSHVLATELNRYLISKFDSCWIPDYKNSMLSGNLSNVPIHKTPSHYIGPLSRLTIEKKETKFDLTILLSGPEPARTYLENKLLKEHKNSTKRIALIRGTTNPLDGSHNLKDLHVVDLADTTILSSLLSTSSSIICRSGYSTIMDLYPFNFDSIQFIPTPGQTEQIYLAHRLKRLYPDVISYDGD